MSCASVLSGSFVLMSVSLKDTVSVVGVFL